MVGYDWALIAELNARAHQAARDYRCEFVDAIRAAQANPLRRTGALLPALEVLATPYEERCRGARAHIDYGADNKEHACIGPSRRIYTITGLLAGEFEAR